MTADGLSAVESSFAAKRPAADGAAERPAKRPAPGHGDVAGSAELEDLPDEISEQEIQRRLEQADELHIEALNESALKRMVMQFERKIKVNQEMRIKHSEDPDKFLKSEVDLDEEVKKLNILATHPDLYAEFIRLGALPQLVGLLNHTNTDIAVDVFEVLSELTDPDVIVEVPEPEAFLEALFEAQLCQMSVDVLLRINEEASEDDTRAVTNCLTMIENLADISPAETSRHFAQIPKLLPWLIKRVRAPGDVDYNRVYASEILGIIIQNSSVSRETMVRLEGVDKLLRGIAAYRKRDPGDSEESEFVQNMFDCLCSLMLLPAHQLAFGKVQGLELMIRMMREHIFASALALRLTDHALRHCPANCQIFVEKLGLKVLFAMFMKKGMRPKTKSAAREMEEHVASIIQSLCRYCTGTPVARVLNKFTENRFEKLERLLELHEEYVRSVQEADSKRLSGQVKTIDHELEVDNEEQLFLDRCDAGLFTLQQIDIILVRLGNMGNRQATEEIGRLLNAKGVPLNEVCETIEEYCTHLDDSAGAERDELRGFLRAMVRRCGGDVAALCPEEQERLAPAAAEPRTVAPGTTSGGVSCGEQASSSQAATAPSAAGDEAAASSARRHQRKQPGAEEEEQNSAVSLEKRPQEESAAGAVEGKERRKDKKEKKLAKTLCGMEKGKRERKAQRNASGSE